MAHQLDASDLKWARWLVRASLRRYYYVADDLIGEAHLALHAAALRFQPGKVSFRFFARHRVLGAVSDYLRRETPGCRSKGKTLRMREVTLEPWQWERLGAYLSEADEAIDRRRWRKMIDERIDVILSKVRDRRIARAYFFDGKTMDAIGKKHGVLECRVCQIVKVVRDRLVEELRDVA